MAGGMGLRGKERRSEGQDEKKPPQPAVKPAESCNFVTNHDSLRLSTEPIHTHDARSDRHSAD
jgi:hypothetical protein